jgi:hypothetical protein
MTPTGQYQFKETAMDELERRREQAAAKAKADEKRIKDLRKAIEREKKAKAKRDKIAIKAGLDSIKAEKKRQKEIAKRREALRKRNK